MKTIEQKMFQDWIFATQDTILLLWGWQVETAIYRWARQGADLISRVEQSLRTGALVSLIGLKSVMYGLGVVG